MTPGDVPSGLNLREVRELVEENKKLKAQLVKMDEALNADIDAAVERAIQNASSLRADVLRRALTEDDDAEVRSAMEFAFNEMVHGEAHRDILNGPDSIHVARDEKWK